MGLAILNGTPFHNEFGIRNWTAYHIQFGEMQALKAAATLIFALVSERWQD
jgi:hypothetical protein